MRLMVGTASDHPTEHRNHQNPESLCSMSALPSWKKRGPFLGRALPLLHRSYGLMRQSCYSPQLRPWPRERSLCRLPSAPAANRTFLTLSLRIFPWIPGPLPRRSPRVHLPVSSSGSSAFPNRKFRSASRESPSKRFHDGMHFRDCSHSFMFWSPSLLASPIVPTAQAHHLWAAEAFTRAEHASFPLHASGIANHPNTGN